MFDKLVDLTKDEMVMIFQIVMKPDFKGAGLAADAMMQDNILRKMQDALVELRDEEFAAAQ